MARQNTHPKRSDTAADAHTEQDTASNSGIPIVGIGASAGGLEALTLFLKGVPEQSGMACIIVQHLDPTREGLLVELLSSATSMTVQQVSDNVVIMPDNVYIIPPNKDLQLFHGRLHLFEPSVPRGHRLPIDFLLQSIAADRKEYGIGVVLSGMGSDGTLGLKWIKDKGGAAFVQDPAQAKFDGMPNSAIESGRVDVVDLAENLPTKILEWWNAHSRRPFVKDEEMDDNEEAYQSLIILLHTEAGHDFSKYKRTAIIRRVERRMSLHRIEDLEKYVRYMRDNPQETQLLYKEILIGVTNFFRDPETWEAIKESILPSLLSKHHSDQPLRAWVVGCSTGEEAFSLAMIFQEVVDHLDKDVSLQIFASDPNKDAIAVARKGIYPASIREDVSEERMKRFFVEEESGFRINMKIRNMIVFASQNVTMDPPFTKIDILCCRNLFIYLETALQRRLLDLFHFSLNPDGVLVLGNAETIDTESDKFLVIDSKTHLYRKIVTGESEHPAPYNRYTFPRRNIDTKTVLPKKQSKTADNLETLADRTILEKTIPAAVLVNSNGDIVYIRGKAGKYLEPAAGKANWNVFAMVQKGLYHRLYSSFQKATKKGIPVTARNVQMSFPAGREALDLFIYPLVEPEPLHGLVLIVFANARILPKTKDVSSEKMMPANAKRLQEAESELRKVRQELALLYREVQTANEEHTSAYEELQSFNEELQSTSEEMTTSKEEMQSLNEELQTVNDELRMKVSELSNANNDIKNLLDSTDIAVLFLDRALRIRRYTPQTERVFRLIPEDVGRPISDIVTEMDYPLLFSDIEEVLAEETIIEKQIHTDKKFWYRVRIMPYKTIEGETTGVTITFFDITEYKNLEHKLTAAISDDDLATES